MRRTGAVLPLLSIAMVLVLGALGFHVSASADRQVRAVRRTDAVSHERTLAHLVEQYLLMAAKEAADFASSAPFELEPGADGDRALLERFVAQSAVYDHGAALVSLDRRPLTAHVDGAVPPAGHPGYAPLVEALSKGRPGVSSLLPAGGHPVVATGVPVLREGRPAAVLVGYWRPADSKLQAYTERTRHLAGIAHALVDAGGTIVTAPDRRLVGGSFRHAGVRAALRSGRAGVAERRDGNRAVTMIYSPVQLGGWGLVGEVPRERFYDALESSRRRVNLVLVAILSAAAAMIGALTYRGERLRARSEARFRSLVQNASDIVTVVGRDGRVVYASPAVRRVLGYAEGAWLGADALALVHAEDLPSMAAVMRQVLESGGPLRTEARVRREDGSYAWFEVTMDNHDSWPDVAGVVVNLRDTSERKAFEVRLAHQAFHDALTGLPNRALFEARLERALRRQRDEGSQPALLFLDLDRFKLVNDCLGHEAGDQLLVAAGERMRRCVREGDTLARVSGDEFLVLLDHVHDEQEAVAVAQRLREAFAEPFTLPGGEARVGASVGLAVARAGQQGDDLVRAADAAMYRSKERPLGGVLAAALRPAPARGTTAIAHSDIEDELQRVIARGVLGLRDRDEERHVPMAAGRGT